MENKLVINLMDCVRGQGDGHSHSVRLFIAQLLAWHKLSAEGKLSETICFSSFLKEEISKTTLGRYFKKISKIYKGFDRLLFQLKDEVLVRMVKLIANEKVIAYSGLFDFIESETDHPEFAQPNELTQLMLRLCDIQKSESVYIPFSNSYKMAVQALRRTGKEVYTESIRHTPWPYLLGILDDVKLNVAFSDPLISPSWTDKLILKKFEKAVSIPPVGLKVDKSVLKDSFGRFNDLKKTTFEPLCIEQIRSQTSKKAVVLLPVSFLFKEVASEREYKKKLIQDGHLEAVIFLPQNILPYTAIPTAILVLDLKQPHQDVLFINAANQEFFYKDTKKRKNILQKIDKILSIYRGREEVESISKNVTPSEMEQNRYNLLAERYILSPEEIEINRLLHSKEVCKLSELVTLIRPQVVKDESDEGGDVYKEVVTADIPEYGFIQNPERILHISEQTTNVKKAQLKPYDILISVKGKTGQVGIIPEGLSEKWIASQTLQILRLPQTETVREDAITLLMFLRSTIGQTLLHKMNAGSALPMIPSSSLKDMEVPIFQKEEKKVPVDNFEREINLYRQIESIKNEVSEIHAGYLKG